MKKLSIIHAQHRRLHGSDYYPQPSRFISEIPADLISEVRVGGAVNLASMPEMLNQTGDNEHDSGLKLGQRVHHVKFGEGTVLNMEGRGSNTRIQVNFESAGSKWLVLAYASLQPA
jgi:DNA helicase-2/ATP-dependent DNA helicase PcrA